MATRQQRPKRLRIKDHCSIMGVIEKKVLQSGIYIRGQNVDDETFDKLLSDEFEHAVEQLPDTPPAEPLAQVSDVPTEDPGDAYRRKRRNEQHAEYRERWPSGGPSQTTIN